MFKLGSSLYNPDLDALQAYNCSLLERQTYNLTGGAGRQAALGRGKGGGIDHLPWALGLGGSCSVCSAGRPVQSSQKMLRGGWCISCTDMFRLRPAAAVAAAAEEGSAAAGAAARVTNRPPYCAQLFSPRSLPFGFHSAALRQYGEGFPVLFDINLDAGSALKWLAFIQARLAGWGSPPTS